MPPPLPMRRPQGRRNPITDQDHVVTCGRQPFKSAGPAPPSFERPVSEPQQSEAAVGTLCANMCLTGIESTFRQGATLATAAVVFIHGLFSSPAVWSPIARLLAEDGEFAGAYDVKTFEYSTPHFQLNPANRIPDLNVLADSLTNLLEVQLASYDRIVLVTHSQGGLIALRYLARRLGDGHGRQLSRVRRVIMFGCPNNGSELMLSLRKRMFFWHHSQERELRPLTDAVMEAQRRVIADVVYARNANEHRCPIPVMAYAGASDNVVTPASARSVFPLNGVVPGNHFTLIQPTGPEHLSYAALVSELRRALIEPFPEWTGVEATGVRDKVPTEFHVELTSHGPFMVRFGEKNATPVYVHSGPIDQLRDVDIVATSENCYMQMAMTFKPSISGRLRRAAARKGPTGEIIEDVACDELNEWMRQHGRFGLPVEPGTVAPTSSGELEKSNIHRIYHAAIGNPIHGTDGFSVNPLSAADAIHNIFALARLERSSLAIPLRSVCLPLFGAGLGGLDPEVCINRMWRALQRELRQDDTWEIHFSTWSMPETDLVLGVVGKYAEDS